MSVVWVVVSTTSLREADKIGRAVLKARLAACYGLYPKLKSVYFWPPASGKLEQSAGPLLVLETLPKNYQKISALIKKLHSDQLPFVGRLAIDGIGKVFYNWINNEIK